MPEEPTEKPKLIIDDDWKAQVQAEKAAAAAESAANKEEAPETEAQTKPSQDEGPTPELPPASFATLVHSLTAQALASLGQIPDADGKTKIEIGLGKHFIDTLVVLEEKTKGNLDKEEADALAKMLHELRMLFVHVRKEESDDDSSSETRPTA